MSKVLARTSQIAVNGTEVIRFAIVSACGCALLAAGQMLPLTF